MAETGYGDLLLAESLDIKSLFPSPLITVQLKDHAALDADLAMRVRARAASHPSVARSNLGGWQSDTDFVDWGGPGGQAVLDAARRLGTMISAVNEPGGLKRVEIPWRVNAWANLSGPGNANEMHSHGGAFWSGAYYVDDGWDPDGTSPGGEFEMIDPRGVAPNMYAPQLKIGIAGCLTAGLSEYVVPRAGQMLMFPAWLYHGVRPYRGAGSRISIAFNLCL